MKPWTVPEAWVLTFFLGASVGCADDQAGTTPVETTSTTGPGTTTTSTTTGTGPDASSGTTGTGTTVGIADLTPWHGMWYALDDQFTVNQPEWWGDGGDSLGFMLFELRADSATIYVMDCLWGFKQYEYLLNEEEDAVVLDPVGGEHKYLPKPDIERLYIEPGSDCSTLGFRIIRESGEEGDLFESTVVRRGELCLECAPKQGMQGVISDCGTPVPWECSG